MKLIEFCNCNDNVVVFIVGNANPTGIFTVGTHPDFDYLDRNDLLQLSGSVNSGGDWLWDGIGNPTDDNGNSINKIHAYISVKQYAEIVSELEGV